MMQECCRCRSSIWSSTTLQTEPKQNERNRRTASRTWHAWGWLDGHFGRNSAPLRSWRGASTFSSQAESMELDSDKNRQIHKTVWLCLVSFVLTVVGTFCFLKLRTKARVIKASTDRCVARIRSGFILPKITHSLLWASDPGLNVVYHSFSRPFWQLSYSLVCCLLLL